MARFLPEMQKIIVWQLQLHGPKSLKVQKSESQKRHISGAFRAFIALLTR